MKLPTILNDLPLFSTPLLLAMSVLVNQQCLNSLIGHIVLPTGENVATRAPVVVHLQRDTSLSSKSIIVQIDDKSQQVSASYLIWSVHFRDMDSVYSVCIYVICFVLCRWFKTFVSGIGLVKANSSAKPRYKIILKIRTSTGPYLNEW